MIKLAQPYISDEAIEVVEKILRSGNLIQGEYVERFENDLSQYLNVKYVVAVSSGTAALHLSLLALGIGQGDEVIVPAFTYPATANVVEIVGAKPILVDINLSDYCINTSKILEAITESTKAIIPVHEFGQSAAIDQIIQLANNHSLLIIEDAACALGTEYLNKKVGTFGICGCFSFHPRKAITTGEGGIIATNEIEISKKLRSLRNHGISTNKEKICFSLAGLNYRLTEFQAALGIAQLKVLDKIIQERITQSIQYNQRFSNIQGITTPQGFDERKMIYQTYHILLDKNIERNKIIKQMYSKGIQTNLGAHALNRIDYFKNKYVFNKNAFPNADLAYYSGLALPLGHHLSINDIDYISHVLRDII